MRRALLAVAVGGLALGACRASADKSANRSAPPAASTDPAAENYVGPELPRGKVILSDAFGGKHVVDVEVAADDKSRERGLMWRRELADGKGMLFIFPEEHVQTFWMRNTLIPLDMIFIGRDGKVVGIVENAEPKTLTSRTVGKPSLYVLEVPGGWSEKAGVRAGSVAEMQGMGGIDVRP